MNFKDLIEIHGFHNIWSEIQKILKEIRKTVRISEQILQNITNITNLEFRIDLNWQILRWISLSQPESDKMQEEREVRNKIETGKF